VGDRAGWLGPLGTTGRWRAAGDWLGLPTLSRQGLVDPVLRFATAAGRFDDQVVDGPVRAVAVLGRSAATAVARADVGVVDAGIRGVAGLTRVLASRWTRLGELGIDGVVRGVAGGIAWGGRDLRRLQTGAVHHYLTIVTVGAALAVLVAAVWR
jgi:NADH-quinone oxidoreductase subunit L